MRTYVLLAIFVLSLSACAEYDPHPKQAVYDPQERAIVMPYPCPDWSHTDANYQNQPDSNYGCAVENNLAVQLDDPRDLYRGHGTRGPDAEVSDSVIQQYRAGKIPVPLQPLQQDQPSGQ